MGQIPLVASSDAHSRDFATLGLMHESSLAHLIVQFANATTPFCTGLTQLLDVAVALSTV